MSQNLITQNIEDAMDHNLTLACEELAFNAADAPDSDTAMILANQAILNRNIASIMDVMNKTMATIDGISSEVQPMIESISKHPMLRMLGGGK